MRAIITDLDRTLLRTDKTLYCIVWILCPWLETAAGPF